ncbi:MAG: aldehyde ferredoxin oxidoreductase family protein [Candidatus Thorarchaeota archaeon]|nr:aldehyde ferredoxin oxidoreductase family protein [Candidatus Thorarchaeota archaeon]
MFGYRNRLLTVDLTSGKTGERTLDPKILRDYIGGAGLACRMIYDMVSRATDPLGPENPLFIMTGPFCGTMVPTGSKTSVCARSPLTGLWGHSTVGGHFGADIRFAGYDGIILTGRSASPVYLIINDSEVSLKGASHLWGRDTEDTWTVLKEESGLKNPGVARIGVAGENLVKYASIIVDHHRAAGRTGMGAVMGSKKLKAIVVSGSERKVPVAEPEKLAEYCQKLNADKKETPTFQMYSDLGTAGYVDMATMMYGSLPQGYYSVSDFDAYNISGTTVKERVLVGKTACFRCPIGCGRVIEIREGKYATGRFAGPELEVTGTMGSLILNNDLEALCFINKQMDLLGVDTISGGNTIAFAYYLFSEGKITAQDLDGVEPKWGDVSAALDLLERIAHRRGIGDLMAEGSRAFGRRFGYESLAAQVNGMELAQHDPRGFSGMAIGYATSPRGACHMTADMYNYQMGILDAGFEIESMDRFANEAEIAARVQDFRCLTNSAVICHFYPIVSEELAELLRMVTGWDITVAELRRTGERIFTLMRLLNLRLGYDTKNERLPEVVLRPLDGPTERHVPDVNAQLDTWYAYRKWDRETGVPHEERLEALGLSRLNS